MTNLKDKLSKELCRVEAVIASKSQEVDSLKSYKKSLERALQEASQGDQGDMFEGGV